MANLGDARQIVCVKEMDTNVELTRTLSSQPSHPTGHDIVATLSQSRSVVRKQSNLSVRSLHPSTSPTVPASGNTNLSPSLDYDRPASWKSQGARSSSSSNPPSLDRSENVAKTWIVRGSRLFKRHHSKTSPTSLRTFYWVADSQDGLKNYPGQWASNQRRSQHNRTHSTGSMLCSQVMRLVRWLTSNLDIGLRAQISEPYNFQHLAHTKANQLETLDRASHSEMAPEFSASRASQIPQQELRGIKAESLRTRNQSSELASLEPTSSMESPPTAPPPKRPRRPRPQRLHIAPAQTLSTLSAPFIDSFCQPSPRSYPLPPTPITPSPRVSSRVSTTGISVGRHNSPVSPTLQPVVVGTSPVSTQDIPFSHTACRDDDRLNYTTIPHAVTTPDELALALNPVAFGTIRTELPNVPEEDEAVPGRKGSSATVKEALPVIPLSNIRSCSFRQSSSSSRVSAASPVSPLSDGSPLKERMIPLLGQSFDDVPFRPRLSRHFSPPSNDIERRWEEDIDFCYEHAAEADCEFDWDRVSVEDGNPCLKDDMSESNYESDGPVFHDSKIFPNGLGIPDSGRSVANLSLSDLSLTIPELDPSSGPSTESSTASLSCPITPPYPISSGPLVIMPLDPSLIGLGPHVSGSVDHVGPEHQLAPKVPLQPLLFADQTSEHQCPTLESFDVPNPGGDSGRFLGGLGKSSSQESFFHTQSARSACIYRDSTAMGSLPDLLPSAEVVQQNEVVTEAAQKSPPFPPADNLLILKSCQPVRTRRSRTLGRGNGGSTINPKVACFDLVSSQHEKPLPLTPPHADPEKPLPSPPCLPLHRQSLSLDTGNQLSEGLTQPPTGSDVSDKFLSTDSRPLPPAPNPIIDPVPYGFFPSTEVPLPF